MALSHLLETSVLTRLPNPVIQQTILELEEEPNPAELGRSVAQAAPTRRPPQRLPRRLPPRPAFFLRAP